MIQKQLDELANECETGPIKHRRGTPSKDQLKEVVEHFMRLFDVEDISGTFARMNDVYVKHAEMANVLHTVRDLLGIGKFNCYGMKFSYMLYLLFEKWTPYRY